MASIKDALDESLSDRYSLIKYILYAIPLYISFELFDRGAIDWFYSAFAFTLLMFLTVLMISYNNTINSKDGLLPSFNIFVFGFRMLKMAFIMAPMSILCFVIGYFITKFQIPIPVEHIQLIFSIIVWSIVSAIFLTSFMLYSKNEKFSDAYNIKYIFNNSMDILFAFVFFIPQILIVDAILIAVVFYIFYYFVSINNPIFWYLCCLMLSINIPVMGNYLAQMGYEVEASNSTKNDE